MTDDAAGDVTPPEPRHLLAALVRRSGRERVTVRELAEARSGKLGVSRLETGDLVVTWVAVGKTT